MRSSVSCALLPSASLRQFTPVNRFVNPSAGPSHEMPYATSVPSGLTVGESAPPTTRVCWPVAGTNRVTSSYGCGFPHAPLCPVAAKNTWRPSEVVLSDDMSGKVPSELCCCPSCVPTTTISPPRFATSTPTGAAVGCTGGAVDGAPLGFVTTRVVVVVADDERDDQHDDERERDTASTRGPARTLRRRLGC